MDEPNSKVNIDSKIKNFPVLLIISNDNESPEIVSKIRKVPIDDNVHEYENSKFYVHDIKTKYYTTQIALHPTQNLKDLPFGIREKSEGIIIHFNPSDRSFLEILPQYVEFIKQNQIEFSIMLCNELSDDSKVGITFKCIKDCYNMLDIIELEKGSDDDESDSFNPTGYDELEQALRSVVWSNVNMSQASNNLQENSDDEGLDAENELQKFETLLSQVMQFRPTTAEMSREDRLNCAQNFAEIFEKLIMQDENDGEHLGSD